MTNDSEVEKVALEIKNLYEGAILECDTLQKEQCDCFEKLARWHIREKEIAVINGKLSMLKEILPKEEGNFTHRNIVIVISALISKYDESLAELRKERV